MKGIRSKKRATVHQGNMLALTTRFEPGEDGETNQPIDQAQASENFFKQMENMKKALD